MVKTLIYLIFSIFFFSSNLFSQDITYLHFEGKIDKKIKFVLDLNIQNKNVTGFYSIENKKRKTLKGTISQDSIIQFSEITDYREQKADFFQGSIFQGIFKGICKFANDRKEHKFKISENYNQSQDLYIVNIDKNLQIDTLFPEVKVSVTIALPDSLRKRNTEEQLKKNLLLSYFNCSKQKDIDSSIIKMFDPIKKKYEDEDYSGSKDWEFNLNVAVFFNSNHILCLNKNLYIFADQTVLKSDFEYLNFDLNTGKKIDFDKIIKQKTKKKLLKLIKQKLKEQGFDKNLVSVKNTNNVGIDSYGLHFLYNLFQTDDFIVNLVEIDLPFDELKDILSDTIAKQFLHCICE